MKTKLARSERKYQRLFKQIADYQARDLRRVEHINRLEARIANQRATYRRLWVFLAGLGPALRKLIFESEAGKAFTAGLAGSESNNGNDC